MDIDWFLISAGVRENGVKAEKWISHYWNGGVGLDGPNGPILPRELVNLDGDLCLNIGYE